MKSYESNISHPNNSHFRVIFSLCTRCVKALSLHSFSRQKVKMILVDSSFSGSKFNTFYSTLSQDGSLMLLGYVRFNLAAHKKIHKCVNRPI